MMIDKRILSFLFILFFVGGVQAAEMKKKSITWLLFDFPGTIDFTAPEGQRGYLLEIFEIVKEQTPEYEHIVLEMPFVRVLQHMKKKMGTCSLLVLKNEERAKYISFGEPIFEGVPAGVISLKDNPRLVKYVDKSKEVDVGLLLADKDLKFGKVVGRFYGDKISMALDDYQGQNMIEKRGSNSSKELHQMLLSKRIDAFFGFAVELLEKKELQFFPVKGNNSHLDPRFSCDNGEYGKEILQRLENLRRDPSLKVRFDKIYERYYFQKAHK